MHKTLSALMLLTAFAFVFLTLPLGVVVGEWLHTTLFNQPTSGLRPSVVIMMLVFVFSWLAYLYAACEYTCHAYTR